MTGHGVLWVVSLGRWKPSPRGGELPLVVGGLFWLSVAAGVVALFVW
jgi:hypothetical protein